MWAGRSCRRLPTAQPGAAAPLQDAIQHSLVVVCDRQGGSQEW